MVLSLTYVIMQHLKHLPQSSPAEPAAWTSGIIEGGNPIVWKCWGKREDREQRMKISHPERPRSRLEGWEER